jgi:hypothetical protein
MAATAATGMTSVGLESQQPMECCLGLMFDQLGAEAPPNACRSSLAVQWRNLQTIQCWLKPVIMHSSALQPGSSGIRGDSPACDTKPSCSYCAAVLFLFVQQLRSIALGMMLLPFSATAASWKVFVYSNACALQLGVVAAVEAFAIVATDCTAAR